MVSELRAVDDGPHDGPVHGAFGERARDQLTPFEVAIEVAVGEERRADVGRRVSAGGAPLSVGLEGPEPHVVVVDEGQAVGEQIAKLGGRERRGKLGADRLEDRVPLGGSAGVVPAGVAPREEALEHADVMHERVMLHAFGALRAALALWDDELVERLPRLRRDLGANGCTGAAREEDEQGETEHRPQPACPQARAREPGGVGGPRGRPSRAVRRWTPERAW